MVITLIVMECFLFTFYNVLGVQLIRGKTSSTQERTTYTKYNITAVFQSSKISYNWSEGRDK